MERSAPSPALLPTLQEELSCQRRCADSVRARLLSGAFLCLHVEFLHRLVCGSRRDFRDPEPGLRGSLSASGIAAYVEEWLGCPGIAQSKSDGDTGGFRSVGWACRHLDAHVLGPEPDQPCRAVAVATDVCKDRSSVPEQVSKFIKLLLVFVRGELDPIARHQGRDIVGQFLRELAAIDP